jgi:hypothetical protein
LRHSVRPLSSVSKPLAAMTCRASSLGRLWNAGEGFLAQADRLAALEHAVRIDRGFKG